MGANCGAVSFGGNACPPNCSPLWKLVFLVFCTCNFMSNMHRMFCTNTSFDQSSALNETSPKPFVASTIAFIRPNLKVCLSNSSIG